MVIGTAEYLHPMTQHYFNVVAFLRATILFFFNPLYVSHGIGDLGVNFKNPNGFFPQLYFPSHSGGGGGGGFNNSSGIGKICL